MNTLHTITQKNLRLKRKSQVALKLKREMNKNSSGKNKETSE